MEYHSPIFAVQDDIAQEITSALEVKLSAKAAIHRDRPSVAAYEAFLKGVHHLHRMTPESMVRAREYLEKAIACDSRFAAAHAMLASHFIFLRRQQSPAGSRSDAAGACGGRTSLAIDTSLPEAHSVLGGIAALFDFNWKEADRQQRLAMACTPISPPIRFGYARHLMLSGRPDAGAEEFKRTLEADPLNVVGRFYLAHCLQAAGNAAQASAQICQALELDETSWLSHLLLGLNQANRGMHADALASAEKAYALAPWNSRVIGFIAGMLMQAGSSTRAEELLRRLGPNDGYGVPNAMMLFHLVRSDIDGGAHWAEKAIEQRDPVAVAGHTPLALQLSLAYTRENDES